MSAITYNGVKFDYVYTESLRLEPERDPAGIARISTKFTLHTKSIIYPGVSPSNPGEDPADATNRLKEKLMQPRKALTYTVNGKTLVSTKGRDDANGPETTCTVSQLSPGAFLVDFTVTTWLTDCPEGTGYLSLSWSDTISHDMYMLTTRSRVGTLTLSPNRTPDPDSMRPIVTPEVPSGFRRDPSEYTLSEDGRIVRFRFVDKEMMTPPPYPAVRMRGMQQESYVAPRQVGNIHLRLDGTKGVNKRDLLAQAVFLCMSRVYASNAATGKTGSLLMGWTVSEGLGDDECWVDVSLNWRIRPDAARIKGDPKNATSEPLKSLLSGQLDGVLGLQPGQAYTMLGLTPDGKSTAAISTGVPWLGSALPNVDPNRSIAPPANGLANAVRLIAAILNDPCGQTNELIAGGGFDAELRTDGPRFGAGSLNGDAPIRVTNSGSST